MMKRLPIPLLLWLSLLLLGPAACKPAGEGDSRRLKTECFSAVDERCYAEMTEYTVLKDTQKLEALRVRGKIARMPAGRKVSIIKRKIDIALVEYRTRRGRRQAWIATKNLQ